MRRIPILLPLALALLPSFSAAQEEEWIQDWAKAQEIAKAQHKHLLIDFTGSDWCIWCKRLDEEVFSTKAFLAEAPKNFVFVKLDFPRNQSLVTDDIRAQNQQLQMEFGVQGYPTIFLAGEDGRPYAKTGYQEGGPEKYLAHLAELRAKKTAFDAALQKADSASGAERARALDAALSVIEVDLALQHYTEILDEIQALDSDGKLGLKANWAAKRAEHDAAQQIESLQQEFGMLGQSGKWGDVEKRCDEIVAEKKAKVLVQFATIYKAIAVFEGRGDLKAAFDLLEKAKAVDPDSAMAGNCDRIGQQMKRRAEKNDKKG
ncbi:MAG: hypothetical protein Fur0037_20580 [Planctomycetota bacterium]